MNYISKLIRNTVSIPYHLVYIPMGMTINPIIYTTISDEISKFSCEGSVYRTACEVR